MNYIPKTTTFTSRVVRRMLLPILKESFQNAIIEQAKRCNPSVVFVYKGTYVVPNTLDKLRRFGFLTVLYYPDVSLYTHGRDIPKCISRYDVIFTAKSFAVKDLQKLGAHNVHCVLHGSDMEVHRKLPNNNQSDKYKCDVSFIGTWSPKKEALLAAVATAIPGLDLRIWGAQWERALNPVLKRNIEHHGVLGDHYAAAIQSSKINLCILSESRLGASSGDLTTARTFEIPACGGFMIHERTEELLSCFAENNEVACFASADELIEKIKYYLQHTEQRAEIASNGFRRCVTEHTYDHRVSVILELLNDQLLSASGASVIVAGSGNSLR